MTDPAGYEAWYHTQRGRWIGDLEFSLMMQFLPKAKGQTLLDVGSGSGYFTRRFSDAGFQVTGIDPDRGMTRYARAQSPAEVYIDGTVQQLPFGDEVFDFCTAVTSLCFVEEPELAVREMWRVSRQGIILGLLNRHSLLYVLKHGRGGYEGARWDTVSTAARWWNDLIPKPKVLTRTTLFLPGGGWLSKQLEPLTPKRLGAGGFLVAALGKYQDG